jgi:hypothetical protein
MRAIRWSFGILLAALGVWAAGLANLIVGGFLPTPLVVCQRMGICETKREIFASEREKAGQRAPDEFDFGYPDQCPAWLRIDDDPFADYCRVVGNRNILKCTMGTPNGLTGNTFETVLERGGPYPNECTWIDYQGTGVPALRAVIGNAHEQVSIWPVTVGSIGPPMFQPVAK